MGSRGGGGNGKELGALYLEGMFRLITFRYVQEIYKQQDVNII